MPQPIEPEPTRLSALPSTSRPTNKLIRLSIGRRRVHRRKQHEHAAQPAAGQAIHHRFLLALVSMKLPGERAAEECCEVLHADHQPGSHGAETKVGVHVTRQYGQRDADVQVADEGEKDDGNNLQRDSQGALGL